MTIIIDGGGATFYPPPTATGITGIFMQTNVSRHKNAATNSSSVKHRGLASQDRRQDKFDPFSVNAQSGLVLANCTIQGFGDPSRFGGALRIENLAYFAMKNVVIQNNFGARGGGAYIANVAVVSITNAKFVSNDASSSGGGLFVINSTSVRLSGSLFDRNSASVVGGGAVVDHAMWASLDNNVYTFNKAGGFGGGLSLNDIYGLKSYSMISNSTFSSNEAYFGSIAAMGKVLRISVDNNIAASNKASRGCGFFWLYSTMASPRNLASNISNTFQFNSAPYGPDYGTEGRFMTAQPQRVNIIDYANREKISASVLVRDYYGQLVNDDTSTATVSIKPNSQINCRFNNLRAGVFGNTEAQVVAGVARFSFKPVCIPGGSFEVIYTMFMSRLAEMFPYYDAVQVKAPTKIITTDALITFRKCLTGEKYDFFTVDKDTCTVCQDSYSLYDNEDLHILSCKPCPPAADSCYSDQIILKEGSWRWNHYASTIFNCPFGQFGCRGGNYSGQSSCNPGYYGPVCGIC
jgi:hypothetical protein